MSVSSRVLAIDPGYDRLGWAVGEVMAGRTQLIGYGCLQTSAEQTLMQRYTQVNREVETLISVFQPKALAIETLFFSKNQKTALKVAEVRGVILSACLRHGLHIYDYNPMSVKQAVTGYGKADKEAVYKMLQLQVTLPSLKPRQPSVSTPMQLPSAGVLLDDTWDAIAVLMTHTASVSVSKRV
jgi:crossover junction endodeoxyribonuclease RuvC